MRKAGVFIRRIKLVTPFLEIFGTVLFPVAGSDVPDFDCTKEIFELSMAPFAVTPAGNWSPLPALRSDRR